MARPKVKLDLVELEKLYGMQCTDEEVAAFLGISTRTLARRKGVKKVAETIERAKAKGRVSVRRFLYRQAASGNIAAAIFLAKNILGYRDVLRNEHSGPEGTELQMVVRSVLDTKPDESDAGHNLGEIRRAISTLLRGGKRTTTRSRAPSLTP
jgi:hypothetical protein